MSAFGMLIESSKTENGYDLSLEGDVQLHLSESLHDLTVTCEDFDKVFNAYNHLLVLCDNIDQNDGMLEPAVKAFVNQNNELADALGISLSMEDDAVQNPENQKEEGKQVTEKKQGIFRRMWEAIKAFIKKILDGIGNFFHWLGSFFSANDKKIDDISKNADQIIEKAKEPATEDFSIQTDSNSPLVTEIIVADPETTKKMLDSYVEIMSRYSNAFDILEIFALEEHLGNPTPCEKLQQALNSITQEYCKQYNSNTCLVLFKMKDAAFKSADGSRYDFKMPQISAPRRIDYKRPGARSKLSAYTKCGWISHSILTSGFLELEERFKNVQKFQSALTESLEKIYSRFDSLPNMSRPRALTPDDRLSTIYDGKTRYSSVIDIHDLLGITYALCRHIPILVKTYGSFYTKFGQMLNDIHGLITDKQKTDNK